MAARDTPANLAHLLRRAGFGADRAAADAAAAAGVDATVERLLASAVTLPADPPPPSLRGAEEYRTLFRDGREGSEEERKRARRQVMALGFEEYHTLVSWWTNLMVATPAPLVEKMTFVWHDHFATSVLKVRLPAVMYGQNLTLRAGALGPFPDLVKATSRDPAMVLWLDLNDSRAGAVNENYARELMELHTLGEGRYSEKDVREAARAFTGYTLVRRSEFEYREDLHDGSTKTVFAKKGDFDGDAVIDLIVGRREHAEYLATKLWSRLGAPGPSKALVRRLADAYEAGGRTTTALLRAILTADEFYGAEVRNGLVKTPVEFLAGALRAFGIRLSAEGDHPRRLVRALRLLGQEPFNPPNPAGWPQNRHWTNTAMALARFEIAGAVAGLVPAEMLPTPGNKDSVDGLVARLGLVDPPRAYRDALRSYKGEPTGLVQVALASPAYQLA